MKYIEKVKKNKKISTLAMFVLLTALALLLSFGAYTMARYFSEHENQAAAVAKPFYFSSDRLSAEAPEPYYQLEAQDDVDEINVKFELRNFVDSLRITDESFSVDCHAEDIFGNEIAGTGSTVNFSNSAGASVREVTLSLDKELFESGATIRVVAVSSGMYEKRLSATYGFTAIQNTITYIVEDIGNMVLLHLGGGSTGQTAAINWREGLIPDTSDVLFANAVGSSASVSVESGRIYTFTFYKQDVGIEYDQSDFDVILE